MDRLTLDVERHFHTDTDQIAAVTFRVGARIGLLSEAEIARALRDISQRGNGVLVEAEEISACGWEGIALQLHERAHEIEVKLLAPMVPDTSEHRDHDWRYALVQDAEAVIRGAKAVEDLILGELRELARLKARIRLIDVSAPAATGAE